MAKKQKSKKPARKAAARRTAPRNKNLEALLKAQQITDLLKAGNVEGQAILDSAGEQRPSDESHVTDLLDKKRSRKDAFDIFEKKSSKKSRR